MAPETVDDAPAKYRVLERKQHPVSYYFPIRMNRLVQFHGNEVAKC